MSIVSQTTSPSGVQIYQVDNAQSAPSGLSDAQIQAYYEGSGGGGGGGGYTAPPPDPYAQWGGKARYDAMRADMATAKGNIYSSSRDAAGNARIGLSSGIQDLIDSQRVGQTSIDNKAVQNELAKKQGTLGVMGKVSRGITAGSRMLGNKNALDSGAAEELANAWGDIGRRDLSNVGGQYAQGNFALEESQQNLNIQRAQGHRKWHEGKAQAINSIVADAGNKLAALDSQIAGASLPDRINLEAEKAAIKWEAVTNLQQLDSVLDQGLAGVHATSADERRSKARELASAGTAPDSAFTFSGQPTTGFQGIPPAGGDLPLFTVPKGRQDQTLPV